MFYCGDCKYRFTSCKIMFMSLSMDMDMKMDMNILQ
jgi:hypothetical protein